MSLTVSSFVMTFLKFCFHAKKVPRHQRKKVQKPGPGCVWMPSLSHPPLTSSGYFTAMSNSLETVEASISYHGRSVPRYIPIALRPGDFRCFSVLLSLTLHYLQVLRLCGRVA